MSHGQAQLYNDLHPDKSLKNKMTPTLYLGFYYPVSQESINYCFAYIDGNHMMNFNKAYVLQSIKEKLEEKPNHLPIRLTRNKENIIGFTTLFDIPYLSEENVEEIKTLFRTFG